jgi:hypothetical protein
VRATGFARAALERPKPQPDHPQRDWPCRPMRHGTRQPSGQRARHGASRPATGLILRRHLAGFVSGVDIRRDPSLTRMFIRARGNTADQTPNTWPHPTRCQRTSFRIPEKSGGHSTRSWAAIPRHRGHLFHELGQVTDAFMGSSLSNLVKRFRGAHFSSHAVSSQGEAVGVVNQAVEDGVGEGGIADGLVPLVDRQLACDDG